MSRASDAPVVDWGDHGTVVSSIVAKYAPEAEITLYKECEADTQNNSPYPQIVAGLMAVGIYRAVHDGADVINISARREGLFRRTAGSLPGFFRAQDVFAMWLVLADSASRAHATPQIELDPFLKREELSSTRT